MKQKIDELFEIYARFEADTADYRLKAACAKGCAFCCSDAGAIDITTLEGLVIGEQMGKMPRARQTNIKKALARDMKKRRAGGISPCPFLLKTRACMIYAIRPFACRRIYSLHVCTTEKPAQIHRRVMSLARESIRSLQRLDENGYSGHISYILHLLEAPKFRNTYLSGDFKPEEVMVFGKQHGIIINKMIDPRHFP